MKKYMIGFAVLIIIGIVVILIPGTLSHNNITSPVNYEYYYNNDTSEEEESLLPSDLNSILNDKQTVPLDTNPRSLTVLVNRNYLLPSTYIPDNLVEPDIKFNFSYSHDKRKLQAVAASALEKLFRAAEKEHYTFYGVSGYRSFTRQQQIYNRNVSVRGITATDSVSAKPGSSEHQTGLAIDVSIKSIGCRLDQALGDTPEGKWLAKNCHKYGFIIRYPKGKDEITGYVYEPWHIRYVGHAIAAYLYKNNLTLEEYYGYSATTTGDDFTTGVDVEDVNNVSYDTPSPKPNVTEIPKPTRTPATKKPKTSRPKATPTPKPKTVRTSKPKSTPAQPPTKKPTAVPNPTAPPAKTSTPQPKDEIPDTE